MTSRGLDTGTSRLSYSLNDLRHNVTEEGSYVKADLLQE